MGQSLSSQSRVLGILAFAAVYIVWGSTYLAIRYAIETIPPWGLSAARYFIAGILMVAIAFVRRERKMTRDQFKIAMWSGPLLVVANGGVCVIELWVPSGVAAVVIGAMPIWIMIIGWVAFGQLRPTVQKIIGALIGLSGIGLIAAGDFSQSQTGVAGFGSLFLVMSSWLWAAGTLVQRKATALKSVFYFSGYQMLAGALITGLLSLIFEKPWAINYSAISTVSLLALLYLIFLGSILAFTAYSWLSRNYEPHLVSTYALVNPLIAVALGAVFYDEPVGPKFLIAAVLVLVGLALLVFSKSKRRVKKI